MWSAWPYLLFSNQIFRQVLKVPQPDPITEWLVPGWKTETVLPERAWQTWVLGPVATEELEPLRFQGFPGPQLWRSAGRKFSRSVLTEHMLEGFLTCTPQHFHWGLNGFRDVDSCNQPSPPSPSNPDLTLRKCSSVNKWPGIVDFSLLLGSFLSAFKTCLNF